MNFDLLLDSLLLQLRSLTITLIDSVGFFFLLFLSDLYALIAPIIGQPVP